VNLQNDLPHTPRGWLKNGNPPGDFTKATRCGAKTRKGTPCLGPAMKNGKCRMHGGKSTGAKTINGKLRAQTANWRHGYYSVKAKRERSKIHKLIAQCNDTLGELFPC
jgi:hypothetical protein